MKAIFAVPAIIAIAYRAYSHKSLTPVGLVVGILSAIVHAIHPWNFPFVLFAVFFLAGSRVTKVKANIKEQLTLLSTGSVGGEGPRTHIQVLANSGVASILILLHAYILNQSSHSGFPEICVPRHSDLLVVGIIANYAVVTADTFSSELGILSNDQPRLITSPTLRKVPKGTNGGVTIWGLVAGLIGSIIIAITAIISVPFCSLQSQFMEEALGDLGYPTLGWTWGDKINFAMAIAIWGALGSVVDSILGGLFQQSVVDTRTGKIVEGDGGKRVLISKVGSGPNSMHFKKRAELKRKVLSGEGKNSVPQAAIIEENLDEKMGAGPGETKKTRHSSFGDGQPSREVINGSSLLDNNEVNFLMALAMSVGAMMIAGWQWGIPLQSIIGR